MRANDVQPTEPVRHGTYMCLTVPPGERRAAAALPVAALAGRLGLRNEFGPGGGHPPDAVAFLRGAGAIPAHLTDPGLLNAHAVIHVASADASTVAGFCAELARLLGPAVRQRMLAGSYAR